MNYLALQIMFQGKPMIVEPGTPKNMAELLVLTAMADLENPLEKKTSSIYKNHYEPTLVIVPGIEGKTFGQSYSELCESVGEDLVGKKLFIDQIADISSQRHILGFFLKPGVVLTPVTMEQAIESDVGTLHEIFGVVRS